MRTCADVLLHACAHAHVRQVLACWRGRCEAIDFDAAASSGGGRAILNSQCPICLCDFEPGQRLWRLHCSHAGCDECFEDLCVPRSRSADLP